MLRMSKRTWNNVLIFSMIGLILILNLDKFRSDEPKARLIVPEGDYIISMQINQVEIEKAGQLWRINQSSLDSEFNVDSERLLGLVKSWQQAYISPAEIEFDSELFSTPSVLVVISLAGVSKPVVVALNILQEQLFLVLDKQVYILNSPTIKQLLEPIVSVTQ